MIPVLKPEAISPVLYHTYDGNVGGDVDDVDDVDSDVQVLKLKTQIIEISLTPFFY